MTESRPNILALDCGVLRADLITSRQTTALGERVLVRHPETGKTFMFSEGAFRVLQSLQPGKPARDSIAASFANGLEQSPATAQLIAHASSALLLTGAGASEAKPAAALPQAAKWNPLYIRIPILDPQPAVRLLRPFARVAFHPWTVRLWALALLTALAASASAWNRCGLELRLFRQFHWWPVLYAALAVSAVVHEFAHVMICDRYGVAVKQVGLLFYFLNPGAYADVSGAWMLPRRGQRVTVALAGVYVESMLWIFATAFWLSTRSGALHDIALVFGLCLSTRIVLNLIPFLRLDGYWVLADSIGIPNLRSASIAYLCGLIPGLRFGNTLRGRFTGKQKAILSAYASAMLLFTLLALVLMLRNILGFAARVWPGNAAAGLWANGVVLLVVTILAILNLGYRAGLRRKV